LALKTQPPPGFPAFDRGGCASALIEPVIVGRDGGTMVFTATSGGEPRPLSWPAGFSARLFNGRAELVTPLGNVYARDGDVLSSLGGSQADNGDIVVCFASSDEYKNGPPL
jgi:hypothetical protein